MRMATICACIFFLNVETFGEEYLPSSISVVQRAINSVLITQDGNRMAVYGPPSADAAGIEQLLLTHHRRDVLTAAREMATDELAIVAPLREQYWFEQPHDFWKTFVTSRFHDYAQYTTKILAAPLPVDRWVKEGDVVRWRNIEFQVLETPGYTRGGVSYIAVIEGKKVAFTGDLIYGDGKVLDLYSFQDAIPEAQIRGYHGYGSRLESLVTSLRKVARQNPDVLIPSRGPIIRDPRSAIAKLIKRVRSLYHNYLSTNALHWYFKERRMRQCGDRVLGPNADVELMPYCHHEQTPSWVFEQSTSRLLIAQNKHGFLLDCGNQRVIDTIKKLIEDQVIKQVDGIFVTHYHDDHTDSVQAAATEFQCPVYATREYKDVLEHPAAYHLPAMTANPIDDVKGVSDGHKIKWQEFDLTFRFFPGQTYYHGALFAEKPGSKPIFFIGDAFAPSGIDDYCVLNRNLVHDDDGYVYCLQQLREMSKPYWLVNEHIPYVFSFSEKELDYLQSRYQKRVDILRELFPWDDPNYGVDEQWAVFYPYGVTSKPSDVVDLEVRLTNHSPKARTFSVTPRVTAEMEIVDASVKPLTIPSRQTGVVRIQVKVPEQPGHYLVTADVRSTGMEFQDWVEALVTVE